MSFEIGDIVKLSPTARRWKSSYNGMSYVDSEQLKFDTEYVIKNSITAGKDEWVDIKESILIFPAWCFVLIRKSNSGIRRIEPTITKTNIPGVSIIKYND